MKSFLFFLNLDYYLLLLAQVSTGGKLQYQKVMETEIRCKLLQGSSFWTIALSI